MSCTSNIGDEPVIDDSNAHKFTNSHQSGTMMGTGYVPRDWELEPFGAGVAEPVPDSILIPRSEWADRIEELEKNRATINDVAKARGLWIKNQGSLPYCWVFGVTHAVEILRMMQGQDMVKLSPASVGGPVSGYRKVGGWGTRALKYGIENGWVPESHWGATAVDRRLDTPETRAMRSKFQVDEWYDVPPKRFDYLASLLLRRIPCPVALMWWRHLVCATDLVSMGGGKFGVRIRNSWGERWSNGGTSILTESKGTPDECVAPRVATAF